MANIRAIANGNWSNNAIWSPAPPTSVDDVFASGFTVFVDTNIQVLSINTIGVTGIGGGGTFRPNNGVLMTTNVVAGSTTCVTFGSAAPNTFSLIGNVSGGNTTSAFGISNSTGTVNITGNVLGGSGSSASGIATSGPINLFGSLQAGSGSGAYGIDVGGLATITIFGNVSGGSGSAARGIWVPGVNLINVFGNLFGGSNTGGNCYAIANVSTGTVNITGNCFFGANSNFNGAVQNNSSGVVTINGNIFGGSANGTINNVAGGTVTITGNAQGGVASSSYAVNNNSTGTVRISGSAIGGIGSTAYGAFNNSTGILRVKRAVGNEWGLGYTTAVASVPGVFSNAQGSQTFVEELELGPRGQWPTGGVIFFTPNTRASSMFETDTFQPYTLIQSNSADNLVPPVSSVRQGTTYNLGLSTGTCIIPPVSSVAAGALVDNLTGIAVLTPQTTWNYPTTASDVNSMGGRLRNALNTNSANSLINSFNP